MTAPAPGPKPEASTDRGQAKGRTTLADLFAQDPHPPKAPSVKPLSAQKQHFLETGAFGTSAGKPPFAAERLAFSDMRMLAESYRRTHGASIHIAGDVLPGQMHSMHDHHAKQELADFDAKMAAPNAGSWMLAKLWTEFSHDPALADLTTGTDPSSPRIQQAIAQRVETNHLGLRDRVMTRAHALRQNIPQMVERAGLPDWGGVRELQALASNPGGQAHGYLFPTNRSDRHGNGHAETYVVTSGGHVINPIPFPAQGAPVVAGQYTANTAALMLDGNELSVQGGPIGCGTIGMSYLKQYLKDDAKVLNEGSLLVDASVNGQAVKFHLPAAEVLKYTQSDLYAKVMRAIVAGEGPTATVTHKGETYQVRTLKGLMQAGAQISRPDGSPVAGGLDAFRDRYLEHCDVSDEQRAQMRTGGRNQYVAYASQRLNEKAAALARTVQAGPPGTAESRHKPSP